MHTPAPAVGIQGVVPTASPIPSGIQKLGGLERLSLQLLLAPARRHIQKPTLCSKAAAATLLVLPAR
jgi:hypothetical protein